MQMKLNEISLLMKNLILFLTVGIPFISCSDTAKTDNDSISTNDSISESIFIHGNTIKTRYNVPKGFHRVDVASGSFAEYLQNLPLKPEGYVTHLYDGSEKKKKVSTSVIDMDIDAVDLQQCADAIIRLRAEYLYKTNQYDKIHFNFTNGFRCDYTKWAQGYRIKVNGNTASWYKAQEEDYSYETFRKYLLKVFEFAGTVSLANELEDVSPEEFGVGTIIITPGFPGHAAIVVDMILKDDYRGNPYGKMGVLLAQSYMPAQEIEILKGNRGWLDCKDRDFENIWTSTPKGEYPINGSGGRLFTAEFTFYKKQLKRFKE